MIQNNLFSFSRLRMLLRKEMIANWKQLFLRVGVMFACFVVFFMIAGYNTYRPYVSRMVGLEVDAIWDSIIFFVPFSFFLFGALGGSLVMERLKTKTSRICELMLPASMFEKIVVRYIIYIPLFWLFFLLSFVLADHIRVLFFRIFYEDVLIMPISFACFSERLPLLLFFSAQLMVQSIFILGSSIWPKNSFLKTFLALYLISTVFGLALYMVSEVMIGDQLLDFNFNLSQKWCTLFFLAATLFNWVLAYYRLKENEIIQRM